MDQKGYQMMFVGVSYLLVMNGLFIRGRGLKGFTCMLSSSGGRVMVHFHSHIPGVEVISVWDVNLDRNSDYCTE